MCVCEPERETDDDAGPCVCGLSWFVEWTP